MPVIANQYNPDDATQSTTPSSTGSIATPVNVSGNSASTGGNTTGSSGLQNSATPQASSSGRFTNLTSYLNANQGQGPAGQILNNFNQMGNTLQNNISSAQDQFNTDANTGRVQQYGTDGANTTDVVGNAISNPYAFIQDPNNVAAFNKQLSGQYTGPTTLDADGSLAAQAANYQTLANQAGTENGRFAVLQNMFKSPDYNSGQQYLDNLLLQADPSQINQINQITPTANQYSDALTADQATAAANAQQYQTEAAATNQATQNALGQAVSQFGGTDPNSYVNQQVTAGNAQRAADLARIQNSANNGLFSQSDLTALGRNAGDPYYNAQLGQYFTQGLQANPLNIINSDDLNRINALGTLAGGSLTGDPSAILSQYANDNQVGAFAQSPEYAFNSDSANSAINNQFGNYNNLANPIQSQIDSEKNQINQLQSVGTNTGINVAGQIGANNSAIASQLAALQKLQGQFGFGRGLLAGDPLTASFAGGDPSKAGAGTTGSGGFLSGK